MTLPLHCTYMGQPIDTLTKEELLEALERAIQHIEDLRRFAEEERELTRLLRKGARGLAAAHILRAE